MRILSIDTAAAFGSLALLEDGEVREEKLLYAPDGFSQSLFAEIEALLQRAGVELAAIDAFAAGSGPGSFTGVRVALTAVKGLAEACGAQAFGISNLAALAALGSAPLRATILDARRGEVYGAVYDAAGNAVVDERVLPFADWLASLPGSELQFVSTSFDPFRQLLAGTSFEACDVLEWRALAGSIARLAARQMQAGVKGDPASIDANYVRRSDAELMWKEA
jgi:tRNA threonylcarbamoyladenosine biosynthesis protein TsaB